jgi:hypothetical protein
VSINNQKWCVDHGLTWHINCQQCDDVRDSMKVIPPPLTVWAVEVDVRYTGTFVDSLWISQELAEQEAKRRTDLERSDSHTSYSVEEWPIQEHPIQPEKG